MEQHKSWRWRRKVSEKNVVDGRRVSLSLDGNVDEVIKTISPAFFFIKIFIYLLNSNRCNCISVTEQIFIA